jgi:FGFR1 oncogene partner
MVDVMRLRQDENLATKTRILENLNNEGYMDKMKANLRSEVIRVLENEKKKSFGGASKYLKQSELSTTVTKKVVSNDDGLLCAEIIREFLQFYQMEHSLHVFVPEMSLSQDFPKTKQEMEREIGIGDRDPSKPLLLRLIE